MIETDLAIVGAGPAGMAAASEARRAGLSVSLFDEQTAPGGQIWRGIEAASDKLRGYLGKDYMRGDAAVREFRTSGADYYPESLVWDLTPDRVLRVAGPRGAAQVSAKAVLLATGALERPMPLPGWTLPGVTTAGALQILLKASSIVAKGAVLAGNGPLLWLIGSQMLAAGLPPTAIVEARTPGARRAALGHVGGALANAGQLAKGLNMIRALRAAKVPLYRNASDLRIEGELGPEAVSFVAGGRRHRLSTDAVALHNGILPNQQATRLLGCEHFWDASQAAFRPVTDSWGETSRQGIFVAGDGAGIAGAQAAVLAGKLVARRIAQQHGYAMPDDTAALRRALDRQCAFRPFIDALYPPAMQAADPADEMILCRCEEVTAGQIRGTVARGVPGPNQTKAFLRCGMGPCQGRICGTNVTRLIARERGVSEAETGYYTIRPPLKPLPLGMLAATNEPTPE